MCTGICASLTAVAAPLTGQRAFHFTLITLSNTLQKQHYFVLLFHNIGAFTFFSCGIYLIFIPKPGSKENLSNVNRNDKVMGKVLTISNTSQNTTLKLKLNL